MSELELKRSKAASLNFLVITVPALPLALFSIALVSSSESGLAIALAKTLALLIGFCVLILYLLWQVWMIVRESPSWGARVFALELRARDGSPATRMRRAIWSLIAPALIIVTAISGYPALLVIWPIVWLLSGETASSLIAGVSLRDHTAEASKDQ